MFVVCTTLCITLFFQLGSWCTEFQCSTAFLLRLDLLKLLLRDQIEFGLHGEKELLVLILLLFFLSLLDFFAKLFLGFFFCLGGSLGLKLRLPLLL